MFKSSKLGRGVIVAALAFATHSIFAQQPGVPSTDGMQAPPSLTAPQRNVDTEVSSMTKRYGLSDDQAAKIGVILKEEQQKADAILKDSSAPPPASFSKMKALREDETTRVSAVLTPEQRTKYQNDLAQMQAPQSQSPAGFPPPPPGPQ